MPHPHPNPDGLRRAADAIEIASAARQDALLAEEAARNAKASAENKTASAEAALSELGVGGGGSQPPESSQQGAMTPKTPERKGVSWGAFILGVVGVVLSMMALAFVFALSLNKPGAGEVKVVANTANQALSIATSAQTSANQANAKADAAQKAADHAETTAGQALGKAQEAEALSQKCNCQPHRPVVHKKVSKPKAPPPAKVLPPKAEPCKNCVPEPKASISHEEKSKVCSIAVQKSLLDKTIVARLQLDENPSYPGSLRIASVASFEGVPSMVSRSPWQYSSTKNCNEDQATVYQHWPEVIRKFQLPLDCLPTRG